MKKDWEIEFDKKFKGLHEHGDTYTEIIKPFIRSLLEEQRKEIKKEWFKKIKEVLEDEMFGKLALSWNDCRNEIKKKIIKMKYLNER